MTHGRIYLVTNCANGKRYVGKTTLSVAQRWSYHARQSNKRSLLNSAIKKYGLAAFSIEEIATASNGEELNSLERQYIASLGTLVPRGYNLMQGGEGGPVHAETRAKQSARRSEFWLRVPAEKRRQAMRGLRRGGSAPSRPRQSEAMKAYWTHERRAALSEKLKRVLADPSIRARKSEASRRQSRESRLKQSASLKSTYAATDLRARLSAAMKATQASPVYRARMSETLKRKCADAEWLRRRTEARWGTAPQK